MGKQTNRTKRSLTKSILTQSSSILIPPEMKKTKYTKKESVLPPRGKLIMQNGRLVYII